MAVEFIPFSRRGNSNSRLINPSNTAITMPPAIIFYPFIFPSLFFLFGSTVPRTIAINLYPYSYFPETSTFASNSSFETNLNSVLAFLSSNSTTQSGFHKTIVGDGGDSTVYGIFLCRGDDTEDVCSTCVTTGVKASPSYCPNRKQAIVWFDVCLIRYSNKSFFGEMDDSVDLYLWNVNNITNNVTGFTNVLDDTMKTIALTAAQSQSGKKFATADANFNILNKLYTLAQCTPDLTSSDCYTCLMQCIGRLPSCCSGKQGGRVLVPSCNIRYEIYSFYENAAVPAPAPAPPTQSAAAPHGRPPAIGKSISQWHQNVYHFLVAWLSKKLRDAWHKRNQVKKN
ncbi:hypothetical protein Nepgr_007196 [Nepenthes gracilis]|uniref:Gnk2-homologous domain-containing protein n=1 Tax=Nepenthes gracilis TaxID=150966 RepID=A0AAD3XIA3_NEPGR|nr:hypothetical protein Nepgr_007196 [Nepenthes gracilis]